MLKLLLPTYKSVTAVKGLLVLPSEVIKCDTPILSNVKDTTASFPGEKFYNAVPSLNAGA